MAGKIHTTILGSQVLGYKVGDPQDGPQHTRVREEREPWWLRPRAPPDNQFPRNPRSSFSELTGRACRSPNIVARFGRINHFSRRPQVLRQWRTDITPNPLVCELRARGIGPGA
jgi:hypothetical protein